MADSLSPLIARSRRRINLLISIKYILTWSVFGSLGAGILLAVAALTGSPLRGPLPWAAGVLALAGAGFLRSRLSWTDASKAAEWLDAELDTQEAFSAALSCRRRAGEGRFDDLLISRAEALAETAKASPLPALPKRRLALAAAWALAAAAFSGLGTALADSAIAPGGILPGSAGFRSGAEPPPAAIADKEEAKEAAEAIFPRDKRLATLAERALREGRLDELRDLADRALGGIEEGIDGAGDAFEREELSGRRDEIKQALERALARAQAPELPGSPGSGGRSGGEGPTEEGSADGASGGPFPADASAPEPGDGGGGAPGQAEGSGQASAAKGGGTAMAYGAEAGVAAGSAAAWDDVSAGSSSSSLNLSELGTGPLQRAVFQEGPGGGEAFAFSSAPRTMEGPARRADMPGEYRAWLESYYTELRGALAPGAGPGNAKQEGAEK